MAKAQGQISIVDLNDAVTLAGYITASQQKTQMYNPDNGSYTPDWTKTNMVLTPSLFVAGSGTDKITASEVQSVKWYDGTSASAITSATSGPYTLSGAKSHILTIKQNVMAGLPGKDYRCVVSYKDATTGLSLSCVMTISLSRVVNGTGIVALIVTTPNGFIFKNGEVASLTAKAELWRGSVADTTQVTYQWYMMDPSVDEDEGGGVGWKRLTNTAGKYTGVATDTLTLHADAVDGYATVKCIAKDTDAASPTYNSTYAEVASFSDMSDPIMVTITSTGGDVFKNGVGSTTLTAHVYRAGEEIDLDGNGKYTWTKYNNSSVKDTSWGTSGVKTGKTLSVGSSDVDVKATFMVEVEI